MDYLVLNGANNQVLNSVGAALEGVMDENDLRNQGGAGQRGKL